MNQGSFRCYYTDHRQEWEPEKEPYKGTADVKGDLVGMSEVAVKGLVKRFGRKTVVEDVSFEVKDEEFFVLLGPSGGGKTTILRMISGLEPPTRGTVWINQQDVTKQLPHTRNLGVVFQDLGLYPHMDVYSNIAYGLEVRKVNKEEIHLRILDAADKLRLQPFLRRSIEHLS